MFILNYIAALLIPVDNPPTNTSDAEIDQFTNVESSEAGAVGYVVPSRLNRRTCPSSNCGVVGQLFGREKVTILENKNGWVRITEYYDASCRRGISEYVDSGNAACVTDNGVTDGRFAEWISADFISTEIPEDPSDSADSSEELVAQSDDFGLFHEQFVEAANELIESGRCSRADFIDGGGWLKSTSQGQNIYFAYCGELTRANRLYLDVSNGRIFQ
ncbi:SH3 domain-containing protein [Yoonia sp. R2-816]|uniref:SH3 domain-containing protein n=1 Tax=Yoonia sp. R2-816 TaxID=3342638 RepID=UPI0037265C70